MRGVRKLEFIGIGVYGNKSALVKGPYNHEFIGFGDSETKVGIGV